MEVTHIRNLSEACPDWLTGTVCQLPNGQLWRASRSRSGAFNMVRMTTANGTLKAGEDRWLWGCWSRFPQEGGR